MAEAHPVVLHVYDLSQGLARQISTSLLGRHIDAIYHTGIVVFGQEFWFGAGIDHGFPGQTPFGQPLEKIVLGHTEIPRELFEEFLADIGPRFTVQTYSLMTHNCNNFSDEVANFLLGKGIPERILNLPRDVLSSPQGALLAPLLQQLETSLRYGGVPQTPHLIQGSLPIPSSATTGHQSVPASSTPASLASPARAPAQVPLRVTPSAVEHSTGLPAASKSQSDEHAENPAEAEGKQSSVEATRSILEESSVECDRSASGQKLEEGGKSEKSAADPKALVQAEIGKEFAALMAAGNIAATEAAAMAVRKVMARHGVLSKESIKA